MRIAKGYRFPTLLFIYEVKVNSLVSSLLRCRPSLPILSTHSKGIEFRGMVHKMRLNFSTHFSNAQVLHFVKFSAFFFGGGVQLLGFF